MAGQRILIIDGDPVNVKLLEVTAAVDRLVPATAASAGEDLRLVPDFPASHDHEVPDADVWGHGELHG